MLKKSEVSKMHICVSEGASEISKILGETTLPYMESILTGINNINNTLNRNNGSSDIVDKLF